VIGAAAGPLSLVTGVGEERPRARGARAKPGTPPSRVRADPSRRSDRALGRVENPHGLVVEPGLLGPAVDDASLGGATP
jgi:hypothetical protein